MKLSISTTLLSTKVNKLAQEHSQLYKIVKKATSQPTLEPSTAALRVVDEIADREQRKNKVGVYNLKEEANQQVNKDSAAVLLCTFTP